MDSGCKTFWSPIRFDCQVDRALVLTKHHCVVKVDLASQYNTIRQSQYLTLHLLVHRRANSVLAFDLRVLLSVNQKVTANHGRVVVPAFQVADDLSSLSGECKCRCIIIHLILPRYLESVILNQLLVLEHANNQCLDNIKSWL